MSALPDPGSSTAELVDAASAADGAAVSDEASPEARLPRVLLIDDDPQLIGCLAGRDDLRCELVTAMTPPQIERALRGPGSFAVILCNHDVRGIDGLALLARVRAERPESVRMLLTACQDPRIPAQGLAGAGIFRFLPKPIGARELRRELAAGLVEHARRKREAERNGQFQFMSKVLSGFAERLDHQLVWQLRRIHHLIEYSNSLRSLGSLEELAQLSVRTSHELLPGRKFEIEIQPPERARVDLVRGEAGEHIGEAAFVQPLETSEGRVGELRVSLAPGEQLSAEDRAIVEALAGYAALAAWNVVRRRQRDLSQHAAITALALLAERRDDETGRHVDRVSSYCRLVAEGLRADGKHVETITDAFVDDLVRSAPLHDIGKVGIPDSILLKPGKLTSDEWEVMKTHTTIGADTLRRVAASSEFDNDFLRLGIEIAASHHEKWNGTGYPAGLAGEAIPLSARIVALADCYDALTTKRPYKQAWTHAAALQYVVEHAGTQFDPAVIAAFAARADQADAIRQRLADEPTA
ncbi:MAG: HD domain-containing protein [Planctomycetota bacterium]|nr:MAG: HD domain-containing protein [Planctomycetota bacterium]